MQEEKRCGDLISRWQLKFSNNANGLFITKTLFFSAILEHFKYLYAS
jgi:hypothetical protein